MTVPYTFSVTAIRVASANLTTLIINGLKHLQHRVSSVGRAHRSVPTPYVAVGRLSLKHFI